LTTAWNAPISNFFSAESEFNEFENRADFRVGLYKQSQIVQNGNGRCVEMGGVAVKPAVHTASMDGFVSPDNIWLDHRTPYIRIWLSDTIKTEISKK
jgi:hypothetical protein